MIMIITNNELPYQFILINMFNICLSVFKLDKYDTANEKKNHPDDERTY